MEYVLGLLGGALWGAFAAWINMLITKHFIKKGPGKGLLLLNVCRNAVDIAALAVIFFLRNLLPVNFAACIIACAISLSGFTIYTGFRMSR